MITSIRPFLAYLLDPTAERTRAERDGLQAKLDSANTLAVQMQERLDRQAQAIADLTEERDKAKADASKWAKQSLIKGGDLAEAEQERGRLSVALREMEADRDHYRRGVAHWLAKKHGWGRKCGGCRGCGDDSLINSNVCVGAGWIADEATMSKVVGRTALAGVPQGAPPPKVRSRDDLPAFRLTGRFWREGKRDPEPAEWLGTYEQIRAAYVENHSKGLCGIDLWAPKSREIYDSRVGAEWVAICIPDDWWPAAVEKARVGVPTAPPAEPTRTWPVVCNKCGRGAGKHGLNLPCTLAKCDGVLVRRLPVQTPACDKCSQGVMDSGNPHLWGECTCPCHRAPPKPPETPVKGESDGTAVHIPLQVGEHDASLHASAAPAVGDADAAGLLADQTVVPPGEPPLTPQLLRSAYHLGEEPPWEAASHEERDAWGRVADVASERAAPPVLDREAPLDALAILRDLAAVRSIMTADEQVELFSIVSRARAYLARVPTPALDREAPPVTLEAALSAIDAAPHAPGCRWMVPGECCCWKAPWLRRASVVAPEPAADKNPFYMTHSCDRGRHGECPGALCGCPCHRKVADREALVRLCMLGYVGRAAHVKWESLADGCREQWRGAAEAVARAAGGCDWRDLQTIQGLKREIEEQKRARVREVIEADQRIVQVRQEVADVVRRLRARGDGMKALYDAARAGLNTALAERDALAAELERSRQATQTAVKVGLKAEQERDNLAANCAHKNKLIEEHYEARKAAEAERDTLRTQLDRANERMHFLTGDEARSWLELSVYHYLRFVKRDWNGQRISPDDATAAGTWITDRFMENEKAWDEAHNVTDRPAFPVECKRCAGFIRTILLERDHAQRVEVPDALERLTAAETEATHLRTRVRELESEHGGAVEDTTHWIEQHAEVSAEASRLRTAIQDALLLPHETGHRANAMANILRRALTPKEQGPTLVESATDTPKETP